jgi:cyanophycin synthetase
MSETIIRQLQGFAGPSIYARHPVVRVRIDGGGAGALPRALLRERLAALLAPSVELKRARAPIEALFGEADPVHWADAFGALAVALQDDRIGPLLAYRVEGGTGDGGAGDDEAGERAAGTNERVILIGTNEPPLAEVVAPFAARLTALLYADGRGESGGGEKSASERLSERSIERVRDEFLTIRSKVRLNINTKLLVEAARKRDIPVMPLVPGRGIMLLGQGRKGRRILQCLADTTSALASRIAGDKSVINQVLRQAGVPVPRQFVVRSAEELAQAIDHIGFPLVLKGLTGHRGETVTTGIASQAELTRAIDKVRQFRTDVVIEEEIAGEDYRLTVIGGRLVAASRRTPAQVAGDGVSTVRELIERENERREQSGFSVSLPSLSLDPDVSAVLKRQGHDGGSVVKKGEIVALRSVANLSQGGLSEDVTDHVHSDVKSMAERAAGAIGLDMAGVDIKTTDIRRPLSETKGAILEVNNFPGLRSHYITPTPPRDVAGAVIDYLFPEGGHGRIPTVAVAGTTGAARATCRMLQRIFEAAGYATGVATAGELIIDGRTVLDADHADRCRASALIKDPSVEAAVFEIASAEAIQHGIELESCSVGVALDASKNSASEERNNFDHACGQRLVLEIARDGAVLNADDPLCIEMAARASAPVWWFSEDPGNPVIRQHLIGGGSAVVIGANDGRQALLKCSGGEQIEIVATANIRTICEDGGRINIPAAAAAAFAAGVSIEVIRSALTFEGKH